MFHSWRKPPHAERLLLLLIFAGGLLLRLWGLGDKGLGYDEAATALMARAAAPEILDFHWRAAFEHPPLWQLTMRAWSALFGQSEAALRLLPALAGALAVPLAWYWLRLLWPRAAALRLLTAALVATSPTLIIYSQEARMYSLVVLLALLSLCLLVGVVHVRGPLARERANWTMTILFVVINWLLLGYHYYSLLLVGCEALFLLLLLLHSRAWRLAPWWLGAIGASLLPIGLWMAFSPGFHATFEAIAGGVGGGEGPSAGAFFDGLWRDLSFGAFRWPPPTTVWGYWLLPLVLLGAGVLLTGERRSGPAAAPWGWLLVLAGLLPLAFSVLFFRTLAARYILFSLPAIYALAAAGIVWLAGLPARTGRAGYASKGEIDHGHVGVPVPHVGVRTGQEGGRYGDAQVGQEGGRYGDAQVGQEGGRYGDAQVGQVSGRYGDAQVGQEGGRYGDAQVGQEGGRYGDAQVGQEGGRHVGARGVAVAAAPMLLALGVLLAATPALLGLGYYFGPYQKSEYRAMAAFLAEHVAADEAILLYGPRQHLLAKYYLGAARTYYTAPQVDLPAYWPVNAPPVVPEEMDGQIQELLAAQRAVWLVMTAQDEVDDGEFVPKYLTAVAYKQECWEWRDVDLCRFVSPHSAPAGVATPLDLLYNGELRLQRAQTALVEEEGLGAIFYVQLDWLAERKPSIDYRVTLRLLDGAGQVVAQRDDFPIGPLLPPTTWNAGDAKPGYLALPLPAGINLAGHQLTVNVYDPATGAALGEPIALAY